MERHSAAGRVATDESRSADVKLDVAQTPGRFKLLVDPQRNGLAVEVYSQDMQRRHTVVLSRRGILAIEQPSGNSVEVRGRIQYALVPSLVGTDLLYAAEDLAPSEPSYLPSMNIMVGLMANHDCVMVAVWPPGQQLARLQRAKPSQSPTIDSFSLDTAGQSCYLAFLDHPAIWHEESLRSEYLETDTQIAWQRPFEARWIGRFFIESERYAYPFYFLSEKRQLWGRCIRGWFYYPVWFDGSRTMIHFEKKFPPKGRLLVYYLDHYEDDSHIVSPFSIMRESLGEEQTERLLDIAGATEQVLLEHRNAVCAMTSEIEAYFSQAVNAPARQQVERYADDVATFIRLIRERVFQFARFADETLQFVEKQTSLDPSLNAAAASVGDILIEIRDVAREDLPQTSLEEVRSWTDALKDLAAVVRPSDLDEVKTLTQSCRSVAGTQDDFARDLSILTIQLTEEAARIGKVSPKHARLAEQLIARSRALLRQPTWWEPCRTYLPKSNPGAP